MVLLSAIALLAQRSGSNLVGNCPLKSVSSLPEHTAAASNKKFFGSPRSMLCSTTAQPVGLTSTNFTISLVDLCT